MRLLLDFVRIQVYVIYQSVKAIPIIRFEKSKLEYLSVEASKALRSAPDFSTRLGKRNQMLMIWLYDTGCRVQELVDVKLGDLCLGQETPFVVVTGKGNKTRMIPLMEKTVQHVHSYISIFHHNLDNAIPLFYGKKKQGVKQLSTDAVAALLKKYGKTAKGRCIEIPKIIHPHLLRKTRAMHLYVHGMPLELVAKFPGHVDSSTIAHYAAANVDKLTSAVEKANPETAGVVKNWNNSQILKRLVGL